MKTSRRSFIRTGAEALAFPFIAGSFGPAAYGGGRKWAPNEKVRLACIGIGHQGGGDIGSLYGTKLCDVVALCDTDLGAEQTRENLKKFPKAATFHDFRKMFDAYDAGKLPFDAVLVGTPDHAHFPQTMAALKRRLPVYVEKPLAHTFEECRLLIEAEKKYGGIVQMGNQGHSGKNYFQFKEYVEKGHVKDVERIVAHMNMSRRWHRWNGKVDSFPKEDPLPETLDWDTWLGTVGLPLKHSKYLTEGNWRCWYELGNGALGDWGAHIIDTCHRFLELGLPYEIGVRNVTGHNGFVFPMNCTLDFRFAANATRGPVTIEWYEGQENVPEVPKNFVQPTRDGDIPPPGGVKEAKKTTLSPGKEIYQRDGRVWAGASHTGPLLDLAAPGSEPAYPPCGSSHYANFLLAAKGEEKTRSPISVTGPLCQTFALGCIAQRLNRTIRFDAKTQTVVGDPQANALLKGPPPRKGWEEFYRI